MRKPVGKRLGNQQAFLSSWNHLSMQLMTGIKTRNVYQGLLRIACLHTSLVAFCKNGWCEVQWWRNGYWLHSEQSCEISSLWNSLCVGTPWRCVTSKLLPATTCPCYIVHSAFLPAHLVKDPSCYKPLALKRWTRGFPAPSKISNKLREIRNTR